MKTSKLLCITIISIFTYSCNSDDDDSNLNSQNYSELIIGEWGFTSQTLNGNNIDFDDECQQNNEYQIYSSNGIYEQTEFENLTGNGCEQVSSSNGTWMIDDNILNFTQNGDSYSAEILELNESILRYKLSIDYDEDGILDEFTQTLTKL